MFKKIYKVFYLQKNRPFNVLSLFSFLIISCTSHREQYNPLKSKESHTILEIEGLNLSSKGQFHQAPEESGSQTVVSSSYAEESKQNAYKKARENASIPISYENLSAGGVKVNQDLESVFFAVHGSSIKSVKKKLILSTKEGLDIILEEKEKKVKLISISTAYKGTLDFGDGIGKKRVGDSFSAHFNINSPIQQDLKNQKFIRQIYNHFEKTNNVDCFVTHQCTSYFVKNIFHVELPKMIFLFTTNKRRKLFKILLKNADPDKNLAPINYADRSIGDKKSELVLPVQGPHPLDFGPKAGMRKTLDSFSDIIDLTGLHPEKNPEVKSFIQSLYNHLEKKEINCLKEGLCHIENYTNGIIFKLPKMEFLFSKNKLAILSGMRIIGEKIERSFKNQTAVFNYEKSSIGNIDLKMTKEEVDKLLYLLEQDDENRISIYKEGLRILWDENYEKIIQIKSVSNHIIKNQLNITADKSEQLRFNYRGSFDFGKDIDQRFLGESFFNQFNLNIHPEKDEKAKYFITSLYNYWENDNINCLEIQKCQISTTEKSIIFKLPKGFLVFSNDFKRIFTQFNLYGLEMQERKKKVHKNINGRINLAKQLVGNISKNMTKDEIEEQLQFLLQTKIGTVYREGILINWNPVTNKPNHITITKSLKHRINSNYKDSLLTYQGAIDFGGDIGYKKLESSFKDYFDLNVTDISRDEKAKHFLISLYNLQYDTEINCFEENKCDLVYLTNIKDNILFIFPSFTLVFKNNNLRTLDSVILVQISF